MKKLYVIGAGGFGRETAWLAQRINEKSLEWDICGFIDDDPRVQNKEIDGYPVLGGCDYLGDLEEEFWVVAAIGNSKVRKRVIDKISAIKNIRYATLIDPAVIRSDLVEIGEGCIICAGTILTVDIRIGRHTIINLDCTIGHDAVLGDFTTLYPGVHVSGAVETEGESEFGTGAQIIQGIHIHKETIIGAGSVVIRDITEPGTYVGVPARKK